MLLSRIQQLAKVNSKICPMANTIVQLEVQTRINSQFIIYFFVLVHRQAAGPNCSP